MPKYKFEIQSLIEVTQEGENVEDARINLVDNIKDYADGLICNCCISNGKEIKDV